MSKQEPMLHEQLLNYKELFDDLPDHYLIVSPNAPDFTILEANHAHRSITKLHPRDYVGKPIFEVFPDTSDKFLSTGVSDVKESLLRVVETRKPDEMPVIRYDIRRPNGTFKTHYWKPFHYPLLDKAGVVRFIVQSSRNVTDEVNAEEKFGVTKELLDQTLSIGLVGTWTIDLATNLVVTDRNLADMFGVKAADAAKGLPLSVFLDSIHPEDRVRVETEINKSVTSGGDYDIEYRTIGANGDLRWVITRGGVKYDNTGKPIRFSGVIIDMTERKFNEEAVRRSEAELKFMAEAMPQKMFTASPDGKIEYFNPQWMEFSGLSFEELTSVGWGNFIHPDDVEKSIRRWNRSLATGNEYQIEHRFLRADGVYRWHLTRAKSLRSEKGDIIKWIGTNTDITEKKQSEINLTFLAHASKVLSSSLDYDDTLKKVAKLVVPEIADWCGIDIYDETEGIKQIAVAHKDHSKVKWAKEYRKATPPDLNAPTGISQVLRSGEPEFYPVVDDALIEATVKDKKVLKLIRALGLQSVMIVPLKVHNKTVGAISLISAEQKRYFTNADLEIAQELANRASLAMTNASLYRNAQNEIKRRESLEDELRHANERLELRVKERTLQLENSNQSLERSNQELQDFAYVASHDLQEPLRKIQAFGNLLKDEYGEKLDEGKDYLERMRSAASRMSVLIEDLLAFSRVTTKSKPLTPIDLNEVVAGVISDLETRISDTKAAVVVKKLPVLNADPLQMRQLMQNLIGNALKFHQKDVPPQIKVFARAKKTADKVRCYDIYVQDNGIGFNEKYLDRIFAVFQRLHDKELYEGTGIGLAVCRKIVERHGGHISASSTLGKGSTFVITLPVKNPKGDDTYA